MTFKLRSSSFDNNDAIPIKFTCDGENISPELEWSNPPADTKTYILIVEDYDAPAGIWTHWLIYNIPHNLLRLEEGIKHLPEPAKMGENSWHTKSYKGPCPTRGEHQYHFKLFALNYILKLANNATKTNVEQAMHSHIIDKAILIGKYKRQVSPTPKVNNKDFVDAITIMRRQDVNQDIKHKAARELEDLANITKEKH